jgi:N-methylhydantoinase B
MGLNNYCIKLTLEVEEKKKMKRRVDPITVAIVQGTLESVTRQMSTTMERTARSPIFKNSHDYSNSIFDWNTRQVVRGANELPVHIGSMTTACKGVADFFGDDVHPGDIIYHNDPLTGGGHLPDMVVFKPIFYEGELIFWSGNKAHMIDTGGSIAGGYHPLAEEIYQEGIRIPPVKIYEQGRERKDVINLILSNLRYPDLQHGDLLAQMAAANIAERNLLAMLQKYGKQTVKDCIEELLDIGERNMRVQISSWPDGVFAGSALVEGVHDLEDLEIKAKVTIKGDEMTVNLCAPQQVRNYQNSYFGNTISAIYHAVLVYSGLHPPFNDGVFRPIKLDLGPKGTIVNATLPAACSLATTTPFGSILDAVEDAMSKVVPADKLCAGWGHALITIATGINPRDNRTYSHLPLIGSTAVGSGAVWGIDGRSTGIGVSDGAPRKESTEELEYEFPWYVHRMEFCVDSGGAGKWRGGPGIEFEFEPIGHRLEMSLSGEGERIPAMGIGGAKSKFIGPKLSRRYCIEGGEKRVVHSGTKEKLGVDGRFLIQLCGGGGVGNGFERDPERVREDVINELVTIKGAAEDYGVVINPEALEIDGEATKKARGK